MHNQRVSTIRLGVRYKENDTEILIYYDRYKIVRSAKFPPLKFPLYKASATTKV